MHLDEDVGRKPEPAAAAATAAGADRHHAALESERRRGHGRRHADRHDTDVLVRRSRRPAARVHVRSATGHALARYRFVPVTSGVVHARLEPRRRGDPTPVCRCPRSCRPRRNPGSSLVVPPLSPVLPHADAPAARRRSARPARPAALTRFILALRPGCLERRNSWRHRRNRLTIEACAGLWGWSCSSARAITRAPRGPTGSATTMRPARARATRRCRSGCRSRTTASSTATARRSTAAARTSTTSARARRARSCRADPDGVDRWSDELIDSWHASFIRFLLSSKAAPFNAVRGAVEEPGRRSAVPRRHQAERRRTWRASPACTSRSRCSWIRR